jgi:acyl-CoA thioesterase FadM
VGLAGALVRHRWLPLATVATLRFRHPLKLFQRYRLRTRIVYWDEHTFYLQQVFERGGRTLATAYVCATFLGRKGPVRPADVLAQVGQVATRPPRPEVATRLQALAEWIHLEQKDADDDLP